MAFGPDVLRIDPVVETDRIAQFLQEQVKSVYKRSGIVVGLSGGIDSRFAKGRWAQTCWA